MGHLSNRGYPKELLRVEIQRASDIPREDSFQLQKQKKMERTPLVITYHPALHCRMNLEKFLLNLNSHHATIKFTASWSTEE